MAKSRLALRVKSFSKINLFLQVINRRRDGFHNLKTLFARTDLIDDIILKKRRDGLIKLRCNDPQVPLGRPNLCFRAVELLRQSQKLKPGIEIAINKRIPPGAGLGGGSGNAAAVLSGLNQLWDLKLSKAELVKLAQKIGSDVAFFIYNAKFALGEQRGDKIKPIPALAGIKLWCVLIIPKIHSSTPVIFKEWDKYYSKKSLKKGFSGLTMPRHDVNILISQLKTEGPRLVSQQLFNSLEPIAARCYPEIAQAKSALSEAGLKSVLMSGSGSPVFGICS